MNNSIHLCPLNAKDEDLVYELYNNELITRYAVLDYLRPLSYEKVKKMIESWCTSNYQKHFIIKESNKNIGLAQIFDIDVVNRKCQLGILIFPEHIGNGNGTIVLKKLIDICFYDLNLHKIEVDILSDNERSVHLFEKMGFKIEGKRLKSIFKEGRYIDLALYGLIKYS